MDRTKQLEDVIAIALQHMATAHYEDARISLRAALTPADYSRDARAEFYKGRQLNGESAPAEKVPVVEYWRHGDYFTKTIDSVPVEAIDCGVVKRPLKSDVPCGHCRPSDAAAYEAARKPDKPAIEPLRVFDHADFDLAALNKINELIARVNALEGGAR